MPDNDTPVITTTATNVSTGKPAVAGSIFCAPLETTLPTSAIATLDENFVSLGYISEDGVTNNNTFDSENIKAWGGDTVDTVESNKVDTFQFKLIETINIAVLKAVYGEDNVSGALATGVTVNVNGKDHADMEWVIDMILRGGVLKRIVIPCAKISEIAEIVYKDNEATGYDITITATTDENGNTHYEYLKK